MAKDKILVTGGGYIGSIACEMLLEAGYAVVSIDNFLLNASISAGVKKIVYSSTCAVYGEVQYLPIDENHPTNPTNSYCQEKLMAEQIIKWYSRTKGLEYIILRYFNACGTSTESFLGDSQKPSSHLMQNAIRGAFGIEPFTLTCPKVDTKDGTLIRDYLDVVDLNRAHLLVLDNLLR